MEMQDYFVTVREREEAQKADDTAKLNSRRQAAVKNRLELERQMEAGAGDNCRSVEAYPLPIQSG